MFLVPPSGVTDGEIVMHTCNVAPYLCSHDRRIDGWADRRSRLSGTALSALSAYPPIRLLLVLLTTISGVTSWACRFASSC